MSQHGPPGSTPSHPARRSVVRGKLIEDAIFRRRRRRMPKPKDAVPGPVRYAGYPAAVLYDKIGAGRKALKQLLWGDWMTVTGDTVDGYLPVHARGLDGFV